MTFELSKAAGVSKPAMAFLVMTSFLDAMGFGITSPVLPFALQPVTSDPTTIALLIGVLSSLYALCQFVAAPALGVLSDRYGRRPLLLLCLLGSAFGYLLFGIGGTLWLLVVSRVIDGLTGGNDSILAAYIGDLSEKQNRAANFGLLGAASGTGFLLGPIIGGFSALLGTSVPFYLAAGLTLFNLLWGYFFLPETLDKAQRETAKLNRQTLNPVQQLGQVLLLGEVRWFLLSGFLYYLPFAAFGALFGILLKENLGWTSGEIGLVIVLVGVSDIVVQGLLLRWLLARLGEIRVLAVGLVCVMAGYILFGLMVPIPSIILLIAAMVLFAGGGGLVEAPMTSLLSEAAGTEYQGLVQGANQSLQALAIIIGSAVGGVLYSYAGQASPFYAGAAVISLLMLVLWKGITELHKVNKLSNKMA